MSLTIGRGPFGDDAAGKFNFDPPERVVFVDPFPRRVRAVKDGETVIDSTDVKLVHVSGKLPVYAFPAKHVDIEAEPHPDLDSHVTVPWKTVDAWYEEDERVFVHPRDPYHRIDTFLTSRHIHVEVDGVTLADSTRASALYETGLPTRYYLPRADVRMDLLQESTTVTECAYKGTARHWSASINGEVVEDVAWGYEHDVAREGEPVQGLVAFYNERVDIDIDSAREERPRTQWSR